MILKVPPYTAEPLYNGHVGDKRKWPCKEVLNKSQSMDFLPAGRKNSGLCREVGVSGGSTVEFVTLELARVTFHK